MSAKGKQKKIVIVPHTHWDREWYQPFQKFRHKLVKLIATCLAINQPGYTFMVDGQTVVLEDYLEIKPENKDALAKAIREKRITAG
jgi:mannosylglycerate hydrolase